MLVLFGSGGQIRTDDLWVMSPTSYQAAPPRIDFKFKKGCSYIANDETEVIGFLYFVKKSLEVNFCQTKAEWFVSRPQNKKTTRDTKKNVRAALFLAV